MKEQEAGGTKRIRTTGEEQLSGDFLHTFFPGPKKFNGCELRVCTCVFVTGYLLTTKCFILVSITAAMLHSIPLPCAILKLDAATTLLPVCLALL